jgi:AcrR family transcriptional regulator
MERKRRTQAERSAATRAALVAAARRLFAERGYAAVGTPEVVAAAGVTRGALYHQFEGKADLFLAVYEAVEQELTERIGQQVAAAGATDPLAALTVGAEAFLDACAEPDVQRIVLIEAPAVLGWDTWRAVGLKYGLGLTEAILRAAMEAGRIAEQPVRPLAHVLIGALDEAALYVARADDPAAAREQMRAVLRGIVGGL